MNKIRVLLILSVLMGLFGCAPSIFGVSQSKWDQLTSEQQQETMLSYYRREALGVKAYEENIAPSSVANIQNTNADTLVFTADKPSPFMQRFKKDQVSLKSHQHAQALAHERKKQSPPAKSTSPKQPFFSRYSKDAMSLGSHAHQQALAQQRQQAAGMTKKSSAKKTSSKKTKAKSISKKATHVKSVSKKKSNAKSVSKEKSNVKPVSTKPLNVKPASTTQSNSTSN